MSVPTDIRKVVTVEADAYSWRPNSRIKIAPDTAVTALRGIYSRDGAVTPAAVVETAKPKGATLHDAFEWSNTEAARLYREEQARHLMRSLVVVYKKEDGTKTEPIRAFVKLTPSADDPMMDEAEEDILQPHVYVPVRTVVDEQAHRRRWKMQALSALQSWRRQYRDISEFAAIFEAIDRLATEQASVAS